MQKNVFTRVCFRGVYSADKLPVLNDFPEPYALIANTEDSNGRGAHWIAFYKTSGSSMETFDSYGKKVEEYNSNLRDMTRGCDILQQCQQLQQIHTTVCGQYCMFFILKRAMGHSYRQLIHLFTDDKRANDKMVCQFVNSCFCLNTTVHDTNFITEKFHL